MNEKSVEPFRDSYSFKYSINDHSYRSDWNRKIVEGFTKESFSFDYVQMDGGNERQSATNLEWRIRTDWTLCQLRFLNQEDDKLETDLSQCSFLRIYLLNVTRCCMFINCFRFCRFIVQQNKNWRKRSFRFRINIIYSMIIVRKSFSVVVLLCLLLLTLSAKFFSHLFGNGIQVSSS